jgi:hypothetical protein
MKDAFSFLGNFCSIFFSHLVSRSYIYSVHHFCLFVVTRVPFLMYNEKINMEYAFVFNEDDINNN